MTAPVIDISHHQGDGLDFDLARQAGVVAVIHKAGEGTDYIDPRFTANITAARRAGLLVGAYHYGRQGDGVAQADHFLDVVEAVSESCAGMLLVLDLERDPRGNMSMLDAARFVYRVGEVTGRIPVIYCGELVKAYSQTAKASADKSDDAAMVTLARCPLWISHYTSAPKPVIPANWSRWALWQYTDGSAASTPPVPGIGRCDQDRFNGSLDELRDWWPK